MTDSHQKLKEYLIKKAVFSEAEIEQMLACFHEKRIKRKQFIIQPDFVARHRSFIVQGALRAYVIDENGNDHTIQFGIEDWWISDYNSYVFQKPATMFVEALEDSLILQIDYETEKNLKASGYVFETVFRVMAERSAAYQQRRVIASLLLSAEARYDEFVQQYPEVAQRLPQYALASYLGMTTSFLSKIRNAKLKKLI